MGKTNDFRVIVMRRDNAMQIIGGVDGESLDYLA
jgi:adenosine/AMP kinase